MPNEENPEDTDLRSPPDSSANREAEVLLPVRLIYRATRNLFLVQGFARHASPLTTSVYTQAADEE